MLNKLEQKVNGRRWPNLMIYFIILNVAGLILELIFPEAALYLCFSPDLILQGQVWRLFSFLMIPSGGGLFMSLLMYFVYFSISKSLVQIIGPFKLDFFLILGWVLLVGSGFLFWGVFRALGHADYTVYTISLTPYYVFAMLFVLFAAIFPDAMFLLMFFIPVKGKWMKYITLALYAYDIIASFAKRNFGYAWLLVFMVVSAVLTLVIFMLLNGKTTYKRKSAFERAYEQVKKNRTEEPKMRAKSTETRHKCCICGRTEVSNPELDFRYCSKCIGPFEYCNEHLYTHTHKRPEGM